LKKKLLFVFGTRPEAIKMAPLIKKFSEFPDLYKLHVCVTGQHKEMLNQVLDFFNIIPDSDLEVMEPNQSLFDVTVKCISGLQKVIENCKPDLLFVQGDTTTAFAGALAGYYSHVKVAHIEAGLRSFNKWSPFPEEINRILTGHLADYHFSPTEKALENLIKENIKGNIWMTGNTVIDALFLATDIIKEKGEEEYRQYFNFLETDKRIILITGHRRESFGKPFENICKAIKELSLKYAEVNFVYPVHLNPNVLSIVGLLLSGLKNVYLLKPLDYPYLVWIMQKSFIVLTDSGGIQEEAPSLGKPVLVMRDITERQEGVDAGTAIMVGTDTNKIVDTVSTLMEDEDFYNQVAKSVNPYGDGKSAERIVNIIKSF